MEKKKSFLIALILLWMLGCARLPPVKNPQFSESNLPPQYRVEGISPVKQGYMGCVPACLEMVFNFYGKQLDKETIARWIQRARGTADTDLEHFIKWQGFNDHVFYDGGSGKRKIKYLLSQNYPVLVGGQVRHESELHMIVLIGYDDSKAVTPGKAWYSLPDEQAVGVFIACDPGPGKVIEISYKRFREFHSTTLDRYRYYGLVIYPKK